MSEIKEMVGVILIVFAFTMPIAFVSGEIKLWLASWGLVIATIVVALIGLALLGVI